MKEFEIIDKLLRPLATDEAALNLSDDCAILNSLATTESLVLTKDVMVSGRHFLIDCDAGLVAKKLLAVNLSDLAAMGSKPLYYMLAIAISRNMSHLPEWLASFTDGLKSGQELAGISLLGGDTVSTDLNEITLSMTMIGSLPKASKALRRSAAQAGDDIYVSGTVGDAYLGLQLMLHPEIWRNNGSSYLISRLTNPTPRNQLGQRLIGVANAAIDISDGLIADLRHIAKASSMMATVYFDAIPHSLQAIPYKSQKLKMITGGDDYELLFTAMPSKASLIAQISEELGLPLTKIGEISHGDGIVVLRDAMGAKISVASEGFDHFN